VQDDTNNRTEPIKTYNCSLVNLMDDTSDVNVLASPWFAVIPGKFAFDSPTQDNNIQHQPNSTSAPDTGDAPLVATELWTARNKGLRYEGATTLDISYQPGVGSVAIYGADTGSAAKNGATTGVRAIDDIHGTLRGASSSRGALD